MENKEIKLTDHYYTEAEIDNFISKTQPFIGAIQSNEDLNVAIKDGWYTVTNSKNIVNIPEELKNIESYGILEVKTYNINYKVQILFSMKNGNDSFPKIFFRKQVSGVWDTEWKKIAFTNIAKTSEFINDGDGHNNIYLTTTIIGENITNIDEETTEGWYNINYNITTKPSVLENISSWYGKLEVKKYNDNYIAQTLYTISKNNNFIRIFYRYRIVNRTETEEEPSWSDWKEIANTDALEEKEDSSNKTDTWHTTTNDTRYPTEKLVKDSLDGKSNYGHAHSDLMKADPILIDASLGNAKDLNTCEEVENIGFYYCFPYSKAKYVANTPNTMIEFGETFDINFESSSGKSFFLLVEKGVSDNTTYIKQTLSYFNGTGTFIRMKKDDSNWTDWAQIATKTSELSNNSVYNNIKEGESSDNITLSNQKLINDNINTQLGNKINKVNNNTNLLLANGTNISQSTFITSSQGTENANKNLCTGNDGSIILDNKNNHTHGNIIGTGQITSSPINSFQEFLVTDSENKIQKASNISHDKINDWGTWELVGSSGEFRSNNAWQRTYCNGMLVYAMVHTGIYTLNSNSWLPEDGPGNNLSLKGLEGGEIDRKYLPPHDVYCSYINNSVIRLYTDGKIKAACYGVSGNISTDLYATFLYPYNI